LLLIEPLAPGRRTVREILDEAGEILCVEHATSLQEGLARLNTEQMSAVSARSDTTGGAQPGGSG
jgi:hypothetical protein